MKLDGKQTMEIEALGDAGKMTWEPLNVMKADGPATVCNMSRRRVCKIDHIGNGPTDI